MQLKQSQKEQIKNIINSKLSSNKRGDESASQIEEKVLDLIERQNYQNKDNLQDKLQGELKESLKENAHHISEQISKIIYSNSHDNGNNSEQKDDDQEQNLYKNKFYSDHSDNSDEDDDDEDNRRNKRNRNYKKRHSIQQSDIQSDNENRSQKSDSEGRESNKRVSRKDSYASNHSGKRDYNKDDKDSGYNKNNNQNNGKYPNKYNNGNNNSRFKNDKKNLNNIGNNKRLNNGPAAPLPSFMNMGNGGLIPNLLSNNPMMNYPMPNNLNLMQPFTNIFNPRVGPPAPPTGKPTISQAGTGAPSLTLTKQSKNIIYVFYIPSKLNNVTKISSYFSNKFGAVSAYDKIDETTASIKFEKEEFAQKAVDSKEKPFRIEQIAVTFTKSPAPPKPAFVNKGNIQHNNNNNNNNNNTNNNNNNNGGKPALYRKPNIDGQEPPKQKFIKNENNSNAPFNGNNNNSNFKPSLANNFEQKKKQKQFDEQKRLIQLKFADKLKVMIFIKKREQNLESEIRQDVQRSIDQIKQVKDILAKAQTQEDLQQVEQHELIIENQYEFAQKIRFLDGKDMSLTELRPKLVEYGKVETLKPHIMEKAVDICFSDFESAEKAYFGLQGQYNISFINQHVVKFLKNPFQAQEEIQEEQGNQQEQNVQYQDKQGDQIQQEQGNIEEDQQQYQYDENNQEYQDNQEQAQEGGEYQENTAGDGEQQQYYQENQDYQQNEEQEDQQVDDDL